MVNGKVAKFENEKIDRVKRIVVFSIFFLAILLISLSSKKMAGDDTNFSVSVQQQGYFPWLLHRYLTWSGRLFSDGAAGFFLTKPLYLWSCANAFFTTLLAYSMTKLVSRTTSVWLCLTACLFLGYSSLAVIVDSSLWITGSFNYLWPISIGLFSLILVRYEAIGTKVKMPYLFILAGVLAACGVEQLTACLVCFSILAGFRYYYTNRKINIRLAVYSLSTLLSFIVVFMSPGNSIRIAEDSKSWYPEFIHLSLFEKILRGISWQFDYWTKYLAVTFFLMITVLLVIYLKKAQKKMVEKLSFFALTISLFIIFSAHFLGFSAKLREFAGISEMNFNGFLLYLFWTILFLSICVLCISFTADKWETFFVILASIFSSSVMFFSPTIYASGPRSLAVSAILLIFLALKLVTENNLINSIIIKSSYVLPIVTYLYLFYWMHSSGFLAHSFW